MRPVLAPLALSLTLLAAAPALAEEKVGPCMWGKVPADVRERILTVPDFGKSQVMGDWLQAGGEQRLQRQLGSCGVSQADAEMAGGAMAAFAYQLWAERQLEGVISAADLDRAYGKLSVADRDTLVAAMNADRDPNEAESAVIIKFSDGLTGDTLNDDQIAAVSYYLAARIGRWKLERDGSF